jgi:nucleotidyltransferase/DNA polymerase involved in DNA repair
MTASSADEDLERIPGVGKSIAEDLRQIGIASVTDLRGQHPEVLYEKSNAAASAVQDRCLLYVFSLRDLLRRRWPRAGKAQMVALERSQISTAA